MLLAEQVPAQGAFVADEPPVLARISLTEPDEHDFATFSGAPGCVLPQSWVLLVNLDTGHWVTTQATAAGSFVVSLVAPRGTTIQIKADPNGKLLPSFATLGESFKLGALPGTFLRVPDAPGHFNGAVRRGTAYVIVDGAINKAAFTAGEQVVADFRMTLVAPGATSTISGPLTFGLVRVSTPDGREISMENSFGSTILTPTGLPIERGWTCGKLSLSDGFNVSFGPFTNGRAETTAHATLLLPSTLPDGYYQPFVGFYFPNLPPQSQDEQVIPVSSRLINAPLVRVGAPTAPRVASMLFAETWTAGSRGIRAVEDRSTYAFAPHIATQSDVLVLARGRYRIEPYLPAMAISDRGATIAPPRFALKFPSGSLTARLSRPDGSTTVIGPAPIAQARSMMPVRDNGVSFDVTGLHPGDVYQLTTLDGRFEADLQQYGRYRVVLDGSVEALSGLTWKIAGTYEFIVAEPLVLDMAVLPGTPLEAGDKVSLALTTIPPVPANVEAIFRLAPNSDAARMRETIVRGNANRFGLFVPFDGVVAADAGEYRVDVTATYVDAHGVWRGGSRTWGGVVAQQNSPLIAHGRRGMLTQTPTRQQWFFRSQLGEVAPDSHVTFPFHGGDVAWLNDSAMLVAMTLQDNGPVESLLRSRCGASNDELEGETLARITRPDGLDPHLDLSKVDLWSYAYASVQRPLIRVREVIADGRYGHQFGYWQFHERYGAQLGVADGDLPNDIKFMFGGVVARGDALPESQYGIYGSLFVLIPKDDAMGTRVLPPFQGNGGGPPGGPLFTLKGKPIDLFFHPTAVRPGSILHRGVMASFAGYSAPTLPSKVEIVVTSPSGRVRTIRGRANKIGWFYDPSQDFTVGESGAWKAEVKILFDGRTSAGQVSEPYPSGDVLGSRSGQFYFYVVDASSDAVAVAPMPPLVRPADDPITFMIQKPVGLTNAQLTYTTTMPGFILEEGTTSSMAYTYDAQKLARDFPNLDLHDEDGFAGADTITISLLLSGTENGEPKHYARQIVIQGEELQMPDQPPRPKRRAVR
jgi:hypothetical protein